MILSSRLLPVLPLIFVTFSIGTNSLHRLNRDSKGHRFSFFRWVSQNVKCNSHSDFNFIKEFSLFEMKLLFEDSTFDGNV